MNFHQYLRLTSICGAFIVGFWLPLRMIGYIPSMEIEIIFDLVVSGISVINLFLYFKDRDKNFRIAKDWLNIGVAFDMVCLLPLSLFAFVLFDVKADWLLLLNLLAVRHVYRIKGFLDRFDSLSPIIYRVIPLVISLPLLVHLIACSWIALGSGTIGPDADRALEYVRSIYWAFTTLTTVGYGDIAAKTIPQMLFACFVQVTGVGVFGFILSNVASLLSRSDAAREHHMDNLDKIETFMGNHHIPRDIRANVRAYYHYLWTAKKGYNDDSLLEGLPGKIQSELFYHINKSIIEKVPFLRAAEKELVEDLMSELEPRICVPGEKIFRAGDHGDALYLVHSGQVEVLNPSNERIACLGEGAFFGEMSLISNRPRSATVKAGSFCDLYVLHKDSFKRVTDAYPHFKDHIEQVMRDRAS